jgi:hypothetical protein
MGSLLRHEDDQGCEDFWDVLKCELSIRLISLSFGIVLLSLGDGSVRVDLRDHRLFCSFFHTEGYCIEVAGVAFVEGIV